MPETATPLPEPHPRGHVGPRLPAPPPGLDPADDIDGGATVAAPDDDNASPGKSGDLSVGDPALRKSRLLSRQCATCIFRPGNPMHLAEGHLRDLVANARRNESYIICHDTLPYADHEAEPAICRGFADRYPTQTLQVIGRLFGFLQVDPPGEDGADGSAPAANGGHRPG
ncbi:hypothetical protein [Solwaraspora sp. WMMA2065]|uniref:hypothetical protein n=1 Tax=Solwaraspora sp. WMMA2065 TaxID=3015166 RepID=UPI00259BC27A|nr:hypothetical protein [Solwaraspora sp. WMMA2065]WJK33160.1 hypothetical protein O7610_20915 [Solwaraspora sp. WMMA2065]